MTAVSKQGALVVSPRFTLTTEDFLESLHRRGQLLPLLRGAALEGLMVESAVAAGISVSATELQQAANRFRLQHGLSTARQTEAWLIQECLSLEQLQRRLELDILVEKFQEQLFQRHGQELFANAQDRFSRARLRRMILASVNQARELHSQVVEEDASFTSLASQYSLDNHDRQTGGDLGVVLRSQLRPEVADAVFSNSTGTVTAPLHGPSGVELYLVEEFLPPDFDDLTQSAVRVELLRRFAARQLADITFGGPCAPPMNGVNAP